MTRFSDSCVIFLLCFTVVYVSAEEECDKSKCPGPLKYYEALGCKPVYANPGECCAVEYDCSHLKNLAKDKCYANGHEYNIGEELRAEDSNPCEIGCMCRSYDNETANFVCAGVDCGLLGPQENCFFRNNHESCCQGPMVCLKEGETRATCEVDGKTYQDGEYFNPKSDPDLNCYCMPGYTGENVEPFCKKPKRPYCSPLFRGAAEVHKNCVPVYYNNQNPQKDCSYASRCQNPNDTIIHNHDSTKSISEDENKMCLFGNMKMHIGDELNQGTHYDSVCVKCVCEVPPIPTCQRLPDDKCDVTEHQPFDNFPIVN